MPRQGATGDAEHGGAGLEQRAGGAVLGAHAALRKHAQTVGQVVIFADIGHGRHVVRVAAALVLHPVIIQVHVGAQHAEAGAQTGFARHIGEGCGVVHQRGVAHVVGRRCAAHGVSSGAVTLQVHAVGGVSRTAEDSGCG
ncbi:hypothetical protein MAIT1_01332 [Magnetofaba australis IT-1]|uniref:Uncharacterized protein n=1 Tax=Magnetofaba australis IT-1 TaxID=1434232 RepID=A0A1Y2K0A5_9PROT|nr:hypothetical protein MAIT1_01332 [Magnetofaba australis IT-1]